MKCGRAPLRRARPSCPAGWGSLESKALRASRPKLRRAKWRAAIHVDVGPGLSDCERVLSRMVAVSVSAAASVAALMLLGCEGHKHDVVREEVASKADARYAAGASTFARYCAL